MKKERIVRYTLATVPKGKTDWKKVDALTDAEIVAAVNSDPDAEFLDEDFWARAVLVDPRKKVAVSLRVDEDVLNAFKEDGPGYQTRMHAVLRSYVAHKPKATKRKKRA